MLGHASSVSTKWLQFDVLALIHSFIGYCHIFTTKHRNLFRAVSPKIDLRTSTGGIGLLLLLHRTWPHHSIPLDSRPLLFTFTLPITHKGMKFRRRMQAGKEGAKHETKSTMAETILRMQGAVIDCHGCTVQLRPKSLQQASLFMDVQDLRTVWSVQT